MKVGGNQHKLSLGPAPHSWASYLLIKALMPCSNGRQIRRMVVDLRGWSSLYLNMLSPETNKFICMCCLPFVGFSLKLYSVTHAGAHLYFLVHVNPNRVMILCGYSQYVFIRQWEGRLEWSAASIFNFWCTECYWMSVLTAEYRKVLS